MDALDAGLAWGEEGDSVLVAHGFAIGAVNGLSIEG